MEKNNNKRLFIIDGSSVIYRAFHAVPSSFTNLRGLPTNAVYGFTQTLRKILHDFKPGYVVVAFDVKGPSFRHALFKEYKAERPPMPDLLSIQIPYIKQIVKAFNVATLEMPLYEADDVIATIVKRVEEHGSKVALITSDKDMYQLVDDRTVILDYLTEKEYGPNEVEEKFGVQPALIRDLLGLAGDTSDNIPGVPGIGFKTAASLIKQWGPLEKIYENLEAISKPKLKENLTNYREQAFLSRELATLHPEVPVDCALESFRYQGPDFTLLEPLLNELDFKKILKEMMPEAPRHEEAAFESSVIDGEEDLKALAGSITESASITLSLTEEGMAGRLTGFSIGISSNKAAYIPVNSDGAMDEKTALEVLRGFLGDENIRIQTDNSKALYLYCGKSGIIVKGVDIDTAIASYLINPSKSDHTIESLAYEYFNEQAHENKKPDFNELVRLSCRKACNIIRVSEILKKELDAENLMYLYTSMELPLSEVLACMELAGIKVDKALLENLSKEIETELADIEKRIYAAAGMEFNINSPKQLSDLLFEKLKLKPVKKTKTGFSTDEEVLTQLAARHEVPQHIINFRGLAKLKSTYVDALLQITNPQTGRVHTSFNQTVTATGRLSSSKPNLQNIPVRGEAAGRIREAFIAEKGFKFISADYSQIELRIAAHMSEDPVMMDAFRKGEDIHTRTASEVFGIMPALVTSEMRRRAKAINFGILYGMGPFGLSTELGISMKEAMEYINSYFAHFSSLKEFIDKTIQEASQRGYTVTLFGRRRFIPELKSPIDSTIRLGQRLAINTPIQGTAADMIKAAMIKIASILNSGGYRSRMILQIHDELVFEVAEDESADMAVMIKREMEGVIRLNIPVEVNLKSGNNWKTVE
ncbi:MAG: DNA polymerase I [Deltaproteobacteria bacterium]|nr:DNA polymerase I [Deltaproteobacteria bacterium]